VTAEPAALDGSGKVMQVAVKVRGDSLKLARKVRFQVRPEGGKWSEQIVEIQGAYASANTDSDGVEWWAELLGERDMVLVHIGSTRAPVKEGRLREKELPKEKAAAVAEKKPDEPPKKEKEKPVERVEETPEPVKQKEPDLTPERGPEPEKELVTRRAEPEGSGSAAVRGVGYTSLALGMASLVAGTVMGGLWRANYDTLRNKIATAPRDGMGNILSYEGVSGSAQAYDLAMRDRMRIQAIAANVLWGAGAGLATLGILLYLAGRETADVAPGAGGLIVRW
jgi:hypothetical protein